MSINQYPNIVFVGSEAIAAALGNILTADEDYQVVLPFMNQDFIGTHTFYFQLSVMEELPNAFVNPC